MIGLKCRNIDSKTIKCSVFLTPIKSTTSEPVMVLNKLSASKTGNRKWHLLQMA